eukprot:TRINITY_DN3029_c0_g1_i1.p4 TRINITY_DN3029_c0_g1~~TRINITY_DN3029_c0_g1_i1.p4  ORF type:complete len:100 (-),score=30.92 TRINITY_DN3029_c0_g1_i1:144-443(-)
MALTRLIAVLLFVIATVRTAGADEAAAAADVSKNLRGETAPAAPTVEAAARAGAGAGKGLPDLEAGSGGSGGDLPADGEPAPLPNDQAGAPWSHVGGFR